MRHFRTLADISTDEFQNILDLARLLKGKLADGQRPPLLAGRNIALLFEKPSMRTRLSFEAGMTQLGGGTLFLSSDVGWGSREPVADFIRVLGEYADAVVCRTFEHSTLEELATFDSVPIINGLTDFSHPCQALADVLTITETHTDAKSAKVTFVGDGNNVSRSLAHACAISGIEFCLLGPEGYLFEESWLAELKAEFPKTELSQTSHADEGMGDADFVYTDVWTSMGQESESAERKAAFANFQVNAALVGKAKSNCKILHCLPAKREQEITNEVIESTNSRVIAQAGNRMHAQKGLLVWLGLQQGWLHESNLPN